MTAAHSLGSIVSNLDKRLGVKIVNQYFQVPSISRSVLDDPNRKLNLFLPGNQARWQPPQIGSVQVRTEQWSKLVGILFCPPTRRLGKEEIVPNLEYFHYRSGFFVDFFCVGYGGWASPSSAERQFVTIVDDKKWLFSSKEYNSLRAELENVSRWKYSGETDLLLLVARKESEDTTYLDFSTAIACNLEKMQTDGAFSSVGAFFEQIFRFGQTCDGSDPIRKLSDQMGVKKGMNFLEDAILSLLPQPVGKLYRSAKHYAINDISI